MKKHLSQVMLLLFICAICYAQTESMSSGLTGYKPIYFITGLGDDQVKIQFSMKYDFFYPFIENMGLYIAYTQLMFWDIYSLSAPFKNMDFNPEVFFRFDGKKNFANVDVLWLDYFQLGYEHVSNGVEYPDSRGYNRIYLQGQVSVPFFISPGLNLKVFYFTSKTENSDIEDYIGNFDVTAFIKIKDENNMEYEEIYIRCGAGGGIFGFDFSKGFQEIGVKIRPIIARFRPYIQFYRGYGESIVRYNVLPENNFYTPPQDFSLRIGIIVE